MRWDNFVHRVDEKVSKKEINTALKNDNILIGCEFEFILDDGMINRESGIHELWERADKEIDDYNHDVDRYQDDYDEYQDETSKLEHKLDDVVHLLSDLEDAILTSKDEEIPYFEEEIKSKEEEISTKEEEISDLQDEGDNEEEISSLELDIENLQNDIKTLQDSLDDANNTLERWEREAIDYQSTIDDLESDIEYREEEGIYEQIETPYLSVHNQPNYFDYMENYFGYDEASLFVEPGEIVDNPPEWEEEEGGMPNIEEYGILSNAPFSDYEIGEYGDVYQSAGSSTWAIEPDSSLSDGGIEIKSPPMELPKFINDYLGEMFDWIGDIGETDSSCGFHVHMSMKKASNKVDVLKLVLFVDEDWIYSAFTERADNTYARSLKDKLKSGTTISQRDVSKMFKDKKLYLKLALGNQHFDAINIRDAQTGHVEFRYMGGTDYHKKEKDVKATIGMYAHNLALAMDPDYKRKEYIHKLQRVMNKMEMFVLSKKLELVDELLLDKDGDATPEDIKILKKRRKKVKSDYDHLASIYRVDKNTNKLLSQNSDFMRGVNTDINIRMRSGLSKKLEA